MGPIIVLVDDWNKVLEALLPLTDVPQRKPGDPHPFASAEQSTLGRFQWQRGIASLLKFDTLAANGGKHEDLDYGRDQDLYMDYGNSRNSMHTSNGATRRRSPSPTTAPSFYVVETQRMYKVVRGSGNLPDSARDGCNDFGLDIPESGTGLDQLKYVPERDGYDLNHGD